MNRQAQTLFCWHPPPFAPFVLQVSRALNSVDLADQADVMASKLSGGQKRKLSVAMALIGDPKVCVSRVGMNFFFKGAGEIRKKIFKKKKIT